MRNVLIVAAREIRDRKLLFVGAGLCALMVLMIPILPGARINGPIEVITTGALFIGSFFLVGVSVFIGLGIISRDLGENRMSFYLSRPLTSPSIWLGKVTAIITTALGMGLIVVLIPTILGGGLFRLSSLVTDLRSYSRFFDYVLYAPYVTALLMLLGVGLSLHIGLSLRARTPWLALDSLVLAGSAGALWITLRPFLLNSAERALIRLSIVSLALLTLTILLGNLLGLRRGRSDLHVTHKWTSLMTAAAVSIAICIVAILGHSIRTFSLEDAREVHVIASGSEGPWIAIDGARSTDWKEYPRTFLLDTASGRTHTLDNVASLLMGEERAFFWEIESIDGRSARLRSLQLSTGEIEDFDIVVDPTRTSDFALSPDGGAIAWTIGDQLAVLDTANGTSLLSARVEHENWPRWRGWIRLRFSSSSRILAYTRRASSDGGWLIHEADIPRKTVSVTGSMPDGWFRFISDQYVQLEPQGRNEPAQIRRAGTGELIAELPPETRVLADGTRLLLETAGDPELHVQSASGERIRSVPLPESGRLIGVTEPASDCVLFTLRASRGQRTSYLLYLDTGDLTRLDRPVLPSIWLGWLTGIRDPGSLASRTVTSENGAIYLLDPETAELRHLAGSN